MATKYRKQFEINLSDLEMIEDALRNQAKQISLKKLEQLEGDTLDAGVDSFEPDPKMTAIQSVLGRLHNQKIWYTPQEYVPRG